MMRALLVTLILALLALPQGPSLHLRVLGKIGHAPASIFASARLTDPKGEMTCPEFVWHWADEGYSSEQSDCDPYAMEGESPTEYRPLPRWHVFRAPGEYAVHVTARAQGREVRSPVVTVHVLGAQLSAVARKERP